MAFYFICNSFYNLFNINMKYKILWKKWRNPLDEIKKVSEEDDEEELTPWERKERDEDTPKGIKLLMSQNGVIPMGGTSDVHKEFKLWIGHTNFVITPIIQQKVLSVPGVEVFKPMTPYRFRLAVGRLFNSKSVKLNIEYTLALRKPPKEGE